MGLYCASQRRLSADAYSRTALAIDGRAKAKSYQEDIDLTRNGAGQLTNVTLPRFDWTVPLSSFSGVFAAGTMNQFNADDTVADYNWITPNQFNDMHTTLSAGYKGLTGDPAKISQGDDFLRKIVPVIMASSSFGLTNPNQTA